MRTLSSTLLSAQKGASTLPYLKAEVDEAFPAIARPLFTRVYTGVEPPHHHAAFMPSDGSLIRARMEGTTQKVYVQRVVNPDESSDYSRWRFMNYAAREATICLCGRGSQVFLFYVDRDNKRTLRYRESTNNGASWSAEKLVFHPTGYTVLWVAAAVNPSGKVALFYIASGTIFVTIRTGRSWSNPRHWPYIGKATNLKSISCVYGVDWNLVVCGKTSANASKVWTTIYGDGGDVTSLTWSSLKELTLAESNAKVEFLHSSLADIDTFRLFFLEKFTGAASYRRPLWSFTPPNALYRDSLWREPVPFNLNASYGLAIAGRGGNLWLSTSSGVWRGTFTSSLDITEDILEADVVETPFHGRAVLVLRNDDGKYNSPGTGAIASLHKGSRLRLSPGYVTLRGPESSPGPAFWVQGLEHRSFDGGALLVLHLEDAWSILRRWRARRRYSWGRGYTSVKDIVAFILARAGMDLSIVSSSNTLTTHLPSFIIHPSSNGAQALRRMMDSVPDVVLFQGATAAIKYLQDTDPVDYSYGTDHPTLRGSYVSAASRYNRIQTYGNGVMAEAFNWPDLDMVTDRLLQVHDLNLDTQQKVQERSDSLLESEQRAVLAGSAEVPVNCGQELYDLVEVTDARCGLLAAKRRIMGINLRYSRSPGKKPGYTQVLSLGGV